MKNMLNNLNDEAMKTEFLHIARNLFLIVLLTGISFTGFSQGRTQTSRVTSSRIGNRNSTDARTANTNRNDRIVVRDRNTVNQNSRTTYQAKKEESHPSNNGNGNNWKSNYGNNKSNGHAGNYGNKSYGHSWKSDHNYSYSYGYGYNHYHHPRTYSTWGYPAPWKYSRNAYVFRHEHGDFFFYHNRFYRYSPVHGYYVVNYPSGMIFTYLPVGYREVLIDGIMYYRYGDIYFEATPVGYRIVRPPNGIYISMQF